MDEDSKMRSLKDVRIAVIGLGYVGLPLAVEFSKKYPTIGFDKCKRRISKLKRFDDETRELTTAELENSNVFFTCDLKDLSNYNVYIIAVPTPIDSNKSPDFTYIKEASVAVAKLLDQGDVVIFESTVFPGATEEICVPIIEKLSKLKFNKDFYCGYSPERVNPGDFKHRLIDIVKVTSGSTKAAATMIDELYGSIIKAGTFKAASIRVAEAAKVIENTQRDLNIALINELALLFSKLGLDTGEVLEAAKTKWNFLDFKPGLVGGHCIGVDPYYLTYKAHQVGYKPEIILSGRNLNESMSYQVAQKTISELRMRKKNPMDSKILVLGVTFKENCPDIRNSKVVDLVRHLKSENIRVDCTDPWVNMELLKSRNDINLISRPLQKYYDGIIIAVAHKEFEKLGVDNIRKFGKKNHFVYDLKHLFSKEHTDLRL